MWHPDPDQLALAALPAERRDMRVDEHLSLCPLCRRHVDTLRCTVDLALAGGGGGLDDADPPPDRIWQAITDELEIVPTPGRPASHRAGDPPRAASRPTRSRWRTLALPLAATVVGIAAGLGIGAAIAAPAGGTVVARLAPVAGAGGDPGGSGTVEVVERDGAREMLVRLDGVTSTAGGDYLEAWLIDPSGTRLVSLGALAGNGPTFRGEFTVPADLPMGDFSAVDVSAERWDGDETHSRVSLMRGALA